MCVILKENNYNAYIISNGNVVVISIFVFSGQLSSIQISALCFFNGYLYIGLVSGEVLVLVASTLTPLTVLHCHRSHVNSFLSIDLCKLLPIPTHSPAYTPALSPLHPFLTTDYNSVTFKTGPLQLISFGSGFR